LQFGVSATHDSVALPSGSPSLGFLLCCLIEST
jgi:hypothetical protein